MILDVALEKLILTLEKLPLADCSFRKNDCISWLSGKKNTSANQEHLVVLLWMKKDIDGPKKRKKQLSARVKGSN